MEESDCKPELKTSQACLSHDRLKRLRRVRGCSTPECATVPEDTNPELAIGKHQYIVIERYTSIFNKTYPTQRERRTESADTIQSLK